MFTTLPVFLLLMAQFAWTMVCVPWVYDVASIHMQAKVDNETQEFPFFNIGLKKNVLEDKSCWLRNVPIPVTDSLSTYKFKPVLLLSKTVYSCYLCPRDGPWVS